VRTGSTTGVSRGSSGFTPDGTNGADAVGAKAGLTSGALSSAGSSASTARRSSRLSWEIETVRRPSALRRRSSSFRASNCSRVFNQGSQTGRTDISFSTYFASKSNSRFTPDPATFCRRFVAASVWGMSQTAKESPLTSATVSEMPSTAIEPL